MLPLQHTKRQIAIAPQGQINNAAFTSQVIDKTDFPGADYIEFVGIVGDTDVQMSTLKLMESDTKTDDTTLGGSPSEVIDASTKPGANDDDTIFAMGIDLKKSRKRYLQLQATAGNGTNGTHLAAVAVGQHLSQSSSKAGDRNLLFADYA
jgi:hypothetical protein